MRLNAARQLALRIPFSQILQLRLDQDGQNEIDTAWIFDQDEDFWASQLETTTGDYQLSPTQLAAQARTFRDLESLVKALDTMETIASLAELSRECVYHLYSKRRILAANRIKGSFGEARFLEQSRE